jgi:hypothetical protein
MHGKLSLGDKDPEASSAGVLAPQSKDAGKIPWVFRGGAVPRDGLSLSVTKLMVGSLNGVLTHHLGSPGVSKLSEGYWILKIQVS